ncbi:hypothetical protein CMV_021083 [Castanea mollissima]|uniref:Uncharacterized protein n=1 Tax=Castanea mollissima TaxID=60419 RepID=A0A8J4QVF6_9ROSI|nr:hypothetical protein CMV_021083 [Castanea mollissima]
MVRLVGRGLCFVRWLGAVSWVLKDCNQWVCGFFWVAVVVGGGRRQSGIFGQCRGGKEWAVEKFYRRITEEEENWRLDSARAHLPQTHSHPISTEAIFRTPTVSAFKISRRSNISSIIQTPDKVYNLDWFSSALKMQCSAAVDFKWMLNQVVHILHVSCRN